LNLSENENSLQLPFRKGEDLKFPLFLKVIEGDFLK
jgi:hypothetical protein